MKRNNKGITLIALVITIIVLLILAGVTINLTLGEKGIFKVAQQAAKNYTNEQNKELANINTFTTYVQQLIAKGEMSEELLKLKPGDYIKYESGQKDKNNADIMWRVLYPADSEYGLQIISDKCVEDITIGGEDWETAKTEYNNGVKKLNDASMKYLNTDYAVDARCVGSNPENKNIDSEKNYTLADTYTIPNGWDSRDTGCRVALTERRDYDWLTKVNMNAIDEVYWIASRWVHVYPNPNNCTFRIGSIHTDGTLLNPGYQCGIMETGELIAKEVTHGLRPCITLRYDIQIAGGDGESEATAYKLKI